MMNCEQVSANLSRYYDGEMTEAEACQCAEHICGCETCRCELESFQSITAAFAHRQEDPPCISSWQHLSERLPQPAPQPVPQPAKSDVLTSESVKPTRPSIMGWPLISVGLALAASLLLLLFMPDRPGTPDGVITVDLSPVIDRYAEPSQALAHLNERYSGQSVDSTEAKSLLGYDPVTRVGLPDDVKVVSTSVLKLPVCICTAGKCTCGPAGCNCSATLCKRSDGSELLVLEHCNSEKVEVSKRPARVVPNLGQPAELYGSNDHLTASWVAKDRRLTAIGLRSEREALDMIAADNRH